MVAASTLLGGVILISKPPFIFGQDENLGYDAVGETDPKIYSRFLSFSLFCTDTDNPGESFSFCKNSASHCK